MSTLDLNQTYFHVETPEDDSSTFIMRFVVELNDGKTSLARSMNMMMDYLMKFFNFDPRSIHCKWYYNPLPFASALRTGPYSIPDMRFTKIGKTRMNVFSLDSMNPVIRLNTITELNWKHVEFMKKQFFTKALTSSYGDNRPRKPEVDTLSQLKTLYAPVLANLDNMHKPVTEQKFPFLIQRDVSSSMQHCSELCGWTHSPDGANCANQIIVGTTKDCDMRETLGCFTFDRTIQYMQQHLIEQRSELSHANFPIIAISQIAPSPLEHVNCYEYVSALYVENRDKCKKRKRDETDNE